MSVSVARQRKPRGAKAPVASAPRRGRAQRSRQISAASESASASLPELDITGDVLRLGGKSIKVSNLQKILYPEANFTKGDVLRYYVGVSDVMLKHLRGRTVTLKRYPN